MRPTAPTIISAYAVLALAGAITLVLPEQVRVESSAAAANPPAMATAADEHDARLMLVALPGLESALIMGD